MANPNPQHNPTDGLLVAAYVHVTGTNVGNCNGGSITDKALGITYPGTVTAPGLGQGWGAIQGSVTSFQPVAQYSLVLSLASRTVSGVALSNTCQLTTVLKDVENATYTPAVNTPVYKSYGDPANKGGVAPTWYNPSNFTDGTITYDPNVASVSAGGLITARAKGECIVEVQFPTFDDVMTPETDHTTGDPTMMIYAQIRVIVIA